MINIIFIQRCIHLIATQTDIPLLRYHLTIGKNVESTLSRYRRLKDNQLVGIIKSDGFEPADDRDKMLKQLLQIDIAETAEKAVGFPKPNPPLLPHHQRRGDLQELDKFVDSYVLWSEGNRRLVCVFPKATLSTFHSPLTQSMFLRGRLH